MKPRTRARSLALQVLYEVDIANHPPADVFKSRLEEAPLTDDLAEFARQIIFGVLPLTNNLDLLIARYAPEWPLDQIAAIDRNILRIALWEFAVLRETPIKVAINEAVELAKLFGSDSASRFVNGVLGALADHQHEIQQAISKA
ncbi:MAG TPA: transcription antitermination factor NusB [Anaerolineales bacterium]|nr:transcription antitermination factor NusB [Anaerolineales bacterium]